MKLTSYEDREKTLSVARNQHRRLDSCEFGEPTQGILSSDTRALQPVSMWFNAVASLPNFTASDNLT